MLFPDPISITISENNATLNQLVKPSQTGYSMAKSANTTLAKRDLRLAL